MAAVQITGLTLKFGGTPVLSDLHLTVRRGSVTAIIGRAQSGKSVLLHAILGQLSWDRGTIQVGDLRSPDQARAIRRGTTYVANCGVVEPHLTTRHNLTFLLRLSGCAIPAPSEIDRALRDSEVPDRMFDVRAKRLGARERLSVWLAVARLRRSTLLLLDDPTMPLGSSESTRVARLIRQLCTEGVTTLVTTRDPRFADEVADTVSVLEGGRLSESRLMMAHAVAEWSPLADLGAPRPSE